MQKQVHSSHPHFVMIGFPAFILYEKINITPDSTTSFDLNILPN